jgi:hypothetical protein
VIGRNEERHLFKTSSRFITARKWKTHAKTVLDSTGCHGGIGMGHLSGRIERYMVVILHRHRVLGCAVLALEVAGPGWK